MTVVGFIIILGVFISYLSMLLVLHRFTYKTWIFDVLVGVGMVMGITSWLQKGVGLCTFSDSFLGSRLVPAKRRYLVPPQAVNASRWLAVTEYADGKNCHHRK